MQSKSKKSEETQDFIFDYCHVMFVTITCGCTILFRNIYINTAEG